MFSQSMFGTGFWPCHSIYRWAKCGYPMSEFLPCFASATIDAVVTCSAIWILFKFAALVIIQGSRQDAPSPPGMPPS